MAICTSQNYSYPRTIFRKNLPVSLFQKYIWVILVVGLGIWFSVWMRTISHWILLDYTITLLIWVIKLQPQCCRKEQVCKEQDLYAHKEFISLRINSVWQIAMIPRLYMHYSVYSFVDTSYPGINIKSIYNTIVGFLVIHV